MNNYIEDMKTWEDSFICTNCDAVTSKDFTYDYTGEIWNCKHCGEDTMVDEMPQEGY